MFTCCLPCAALALPATFQAIQNSYCFISPGCTITGCVEDVQEASPTSARTVSRLKSPSVRFWAVQCSLATSIFLLLGFALPQPLWSLKSLVYYFMCECLSIGRKQCNAGSCCLAIPCGNCSTKSGTTEHWSNLDQAGACPGNPALCLCGHLCVLSQH